MAEKFVCQPKDINAKAHFYDAFGHLETEISAGWIVRFCQERGKGWEPFSKAEIEAFYQSKGLHDGFLFNGLDTQGFIEKKDEMYYITPDFVSRCFRSSPNKK